MTYLFNSNNNIVNEVEIKNDVGNTVPISGNVVVYHKGLAVGNSNPLPVSLGSDTINIVGNIAIPTTVNVASSPENPVHVHLTEIGGNGSGNGIILTSYIPIQGNVSATINGTVSVNNFPTTQNVQVINTSVSPVQIRVSDGVQVDTLSRIRTSSIQYQSHRTSGVDNDTTIFFAQKINGAGANGVFNANTSDATLNSGTANGGYCIRQSRVTYKIIPGASHSSYFTINFNGQTSGSVKRSGLFNDGNGLFWELDGTNGLSVVVRRTTANGSIVEDRTNSASFNIDKLDGTGPSGFNITSAGFDKYYTFWFDFTGGRTGRIRFGMGTTVGAQICHTYNYTGQISQTFVSAVGLPFRKEIRNYTTQTISPNMNAAGMAFNLESQKHFVPNLATGSNLNGWIANANTTPIFSFSLRPTFPYNQMDLSVQSYTIQDLNNLDSKNNTYGVYYYEWRLNPTIDGAAIPPAINAGKSSQYIAYNANNTVSGGSIIHSGIFTSSSQENALNIQENFNMGADVDGNPDNLVLCIKTLQQGTVPGSIVCVVNWLEEL